MTKDIENWCKRDEHHLFENFVDFNDWLDSREEEVAIETITASGVANLPQPSKALFAGDKEAYDQAFKAYRLQRRHEVLSKEYLNEHFGDDHWYERNEERFNQLLKYLIDKSVVPFIGAGVSVAGGFPTWANHLRQQGKTAGISKEVIDSHLSKGEFEAVIQRIESTRGKDVFIQEIRDVFSKTGSLENITLRLSELFNDTLITTNYDHLLELAFETGEKSNFQIINGLKATEEADPTKTTIIKLHGDVENAQRCIISKKQYDEAYGTEGLDLSLPIPKILRYYFENSHLLFVGCSLNNDRTVQVFKAIKATLGDKDLPQHFTIEQAPESEEDLISRNSELLKVGITAIWYEKARYEIVESILRHARCEVNYQGGDLNLRPKKASEVAYFEPQPAIAMAVTNTTVESTVSRQVVINQKSLGEGISQKIKDILHKTSDNGDM